MTLQVGAELLDGGKGFAAGDGHVHRGAEAGVAVDVFTRHGFFEPGKAQPVEFLGDGEGLVFGQAAIAVEHQFHAPIDGLVQLADQAEEAVHGDAVPGPFGADAKLERGVALVDVCQRLIDELLRADAPIVAATAGGVETGAVGGGGVDEFGDRLPGQLAAQVPQRTVEAADSRVVRAVAAVGREGEAGVRRVTPDERRRQKVDPFMDEQGPTIGAGFADAADPGVGENDDDGAVRLDRAIARGDPLAFRFVHARERDGFHLGDLHGASFQCGSGSNGMP